MLVWRALIRAQRGPAVRRLATRDPSAPSLVRRPTARDPAAPSFRGSIGAGSVSPPALAGLPSREEQVLRLEHDGDYDVLVIGGGAVGAGAALDAATRGLRVACVERGDFGSETSSRSTKLLWAGIRYVATAAAGLLRKKTLESPRAAFGQFFDECKMVLHCHRERRYMIQTQPHLCHWVPIALPFSSYFVTPPPFGHPLFSLFPLLSPVVFKLYDAMSRFACPPSFLMGKKASMAKFPQLSRESKGIKFVQVFYEAMHNDARTNVAIALTAAESGAAVANYVEADDLIRGADGRVVGATVTDRVAGRTFDVRAKATIVCGGPFTDAILEADGPPAVSGASGTHIVLPGYYCPRDMGLLDYNTSDGRFLFFLPWLGHTIVGTTDRACAAETLPSAPEDEIQWLLNECGKYLSLDIRVSRSDVLSAWRGWRPLASDPHAVDGEAASRDHVVSHDAATGVTFCAGGKWTTWREMAEHTVDRVLERAGTTAAFGPCVTKTTPLIGSEDFESNLNIKLIQA